MSSMSEYDYAVTTRFIVVGCGSESFDPNDPLHAPERRYWPVFDCTDQYKGDAHVKIYRNLNRKNRKRRKK